MLREGLFSSSDFEKASSDFVLLRLEPGPAERYFGITAAPMCAVADWYGRVTHPSINLRGDINTACNLLKSIIRDFDYKGAALPPFEVPQWAASIVKQGSAKEMAEFLDMVHPKQGKSKGKVTFEDFESLYLSLDSESQILAFCENYTGALSLRTPDWGKEYEGYKAELEMLKRMSYAKNDGIKFLAIDAWGKFASVPNVVFLLERIENKAKECRNPNVVLCRCLSAIGPIAERFPGATDKETCAARMSLLEMLPILSKTLDTEGRNNSACLCASNSVKAIIRATGAPEALEVFLHNLNGPTTDEFVKKMDATYRTRAAGELKTLTTLEIGSDYKPWRDWYDKNKDDLYYDEKTETFEVNAKAASNFRKKLKEMGKK